MPDRRRFKEPGFNFRPLRLAVLALVALVFGIGFGSMVSTLFRGSGEKKPAIETEIDRKPAIPAPAPAATPTQPAEEKRGEAPILPPPTIKSDAAWLKHAVAAPERKDRPWIAVVFDDVGLDRKRSLRAIELPGPLTISFMTYAEDLPNLARAAKARGHEIMLHVPMEPESSSENPGPN
ncbi:MAG: hypothetical protein FJX47_17870, partial [Alphaproteobacteria bacterium]|nr:hypothetical protein [Alphaproteobacteria bacterium]